MNVVCLSLVNGVLPSYSFPIYSFFLPLYSFWSMDDFSWGSTRLVVGEGNNQKVISDSDDRFDDSMIPLKRFSGMFKSHPTASHVMRTLILTPPPPPGGPQPSQNTKLKHGRPRRLFTRRCTLNLLQRRHLSLAVTARISPGVHLPEAGDLR